MPTAILRSVSWLWLYGTFLCKFTAYMQGVAVASSVFTIMTLSIDRYLAIRHPVLFRSYSSGKHATHLVVFIWLLSFGLMIPILLARKLLKMTLIPGNPVYYCSEIWPQSKDRQIYDTCLFFLMFVIPGIGITASYSRIGCALWTERRFLYRSDSDIGKAQAHKVMLGRRKVARMLAVVAVVFALCWMPYHCLTLYLAYSEDKEKALEVLPFTLLLGHFNSVLNPLLYCHMNRSFRNRTLKILRRCRCTCSCKLTQAKSTKRKSASLMVQHKTGENDTRLNINPLRRFLSNSNTRSTSGSKSYSRSGSQRNWTKQTSNTNVLASVKSTDHGAHSDEVQSNSRLRQCDASAVNGVVMDHLKPVSHKLGRRKRSGMKHLLNIPTTINEESSRVASRAPSICADGIQEVTSHGDVSDCSCSQWNDSHICTSHAGRYLCHCDNCTTESYDSNDSDSDSFCDVCADAGLIECCHLPPEPAIRMALMRQLGDVPSTRRTNVNTKPMPKPSIKIKVESYT